MSLSVLQHLENAKLNRKKQFVVLIDPDKVTPKSLEQTVRLAINAKVDLFFVGGSLLVRDTLDKVIVQIKSMTDIPIVLFPGSPNQISYKADALLFLSLISGRNADLLIGRHVEAAPFLANSELEVIPTGYMIVDGGAPTTVSYISNTHPIPNDKDDIAVCTALAGALLGMRLIYLDAGSGARFTVSESMLKAVSSAVKTPIVLGGGIRTPEEAFLKTKAGADVIVVGNALEKDPSLVLEMAAAVHSVSSLKI